MLEEFRSGLRKISGNETVVYSAMTFAIGFMMAWGAASSRSERETMDWAIETTSDCANEHRDQFPSISECLRSRYEGALEERYAEAAAEQYP